MQEVILGGPGDIFWFSIIQSPTEFSIIQIPYFTVYAISVTAIIDCAGMALSRAPVVTIFLKKNSFC